MVSKDTESFSWCWVLKPQTWTFTVRPLAAILINPPRSHYKCLGERKLQCLYCFYFFFMYVSFSCFVKLLELFTSSVYNDSLYVAFRSQKNNMEHFDKEFIRMYRVKPLSCFILCIFWLFPVGLWFWLTRMWTRQAEPNWIENGSSPAWERWYDLCFSNREGRKEAVINGISLTAVQSLIPAP